MIVAGFTIALMLVAIAQENEFLLWHSWLLYLFQALVMILALSQKLRSASDLFLPTVFVLVYSLVNLTLGSYLVPRDYGWNKEFSTSVAAIRHYRTIVPYLLGCNWVFYSLSVRALQVLPVVRFRPPRRSASGVSIAAVLVAGLLFIGAALSGMDSAFSMELGIAIVLFTALARQKVWYRFGVYATFLGILVALSFQNKREIVMLFFLVCFLEFHCGGVRFRLSLMNLCLAGALGGAMFGLIMTASILRGYSDLGASTAIEAVREVPRYMSSDMFVDGITDNLELNYNYGVAVTAMDYGITGRIPLQFGATIAKVLFVPVPRDLISFKPESALQLFTQTYAPDWWAENGSMPVGIAADMFLNFGVFGVLALGLIMYGINRIFIKYIYVAQQSLVAYSCLFMTVSVLMLARGSGIELWFTYYLVALPVFLGVALLRGSVRALSDGSQQWLV